MRLILQQVDLIEDEYDGRLVAARDIDGAAIVFHELAGGVGDEEQQVALFERSAHRVHQTLIEWRVGLVDAGCIGKNDLRFRERKHALDRRPRSLRLIGDDCHLLPDEGVEQRRFAGVGPADQGNETGPEFSVH